MIGPSEDAETLIGFADMIDRRLGPVSGRDADTIALMMRRVASNVTALRKALGAMVDRWERNYTEERRPADMGRCMSSSREGDVSSETPMGALDWIQAPRP